MVANVMPSVIGEDLFFVENGAGTYSGSIVLPPGSTLLDVIVHGEALWAAGTSATLIVGDTTDDDGFFTAVNLKATDLLAGESISLESTGGKYGADVDPKDPTAASLAAGSNVHIRRRFLSNSAERTVTAKVTSVGAGTTGRTRVTFVYLRPVNSQTITQ